MARTASNSPYKTILVLIMLRHRNVALVIVVMAALVATWAIPWPAVAQKASTPKAATPKPENKLALGEAEVKQLLLLMDTDKNGKISKEEWMKFMEAEFDRLDKDKSGDLDVKDLTQSKIRASHFTTAGK
jgi:EF hand